MAANPRMVTTDITVIWDGGTFHVSRGTIVDIPAGSSLESAYGLSNLVSLDSQDQSGDPGGDQSEDDEAGAG
jgi:hypothetical protein